MPNVFEPDWDSEAPEPWRMRYARVAHQAGSERLGGTVFEIEPGGVVSPLHTRLANEELVVALEGPVTLRTPEGERVLEVGEVVACPTGRRGAHQLRNRGEERTRVLVISEMRVPEVAEHLDSGKLVVLQEIAADGTPTIDVFRRADAVELTVDQPQG